MSEVLLKIIYSFYSWNLTQILICSMMLIVLWTISNIFLPKKLCKVLNFMLLIVIIIAIVFYAVTNRSVSADRRIQIVPFVDYINASYGIRQTLWLNAFFFLPLGLSLPYSLPDKIQRKVLVTIVTATVFSVSIEAVQVVFKLGLCEFDDVLMNTLGAAIATLSYVIYSKITKRRGMS